MENKKYVAVEVDEYSRLCRLDGRVDAAQNLLDHSSSVFIEDICNIIGIDLTLYNESQEENRTRYVKSINKGSESENE